MKRLTMIGFIALSTIAMLAFQNCSQSQYESTAALEAAVSDINAGKPATENDFIQICRKAPCPAPPAGCRYEQIEDATNEKSFCSSGCGRLVCDHLPPVEEDPIIRNPPILPLPVSAHPPVSCPMIMCAQEEGCRYAGQPSVDENGCAADCGVQVCDTRIRPPVKKCHTMGIACLDVMPGPNCVVDDSKTLDENGCPVACPVYKCTEEM